MSKRSGLGRGLGALIPTEVSGVAESTLREIPISSIRPNPLQPRSRFDEEAMSSLAASIKEVGVLQPVLVRPVGDGEFELIAGERRWRAARRAGLQTMPALVETVSDASSLERALVENIQRADLGPLEEAAAYQQLIEDFSYTHEQVALRVGKSRAAVTNTLRLLQLPASVQSALAEGLITAGHARALLGTPDRALQEALARRIPSEGLSVRAVEEAVRQATVSEHLKSGIGVEPGVVSSDEEPRIAPSSNLYPDHAIATARPSVLGAGGERAEHGELLDGLTVEEPLPHQEASSSGQVASMKRPSLPPPGVVELEELLGDYLDTRVNVEVGGKRGRIVIEFADLDDLERIYKLMVMQKSSPS